MPSTDRAPTIGTLTAHTLVEKITELQEDVQAQSVILAQMEQALRLLFGEMRRANILRYKPD